MRPELSVEDIACEDSDLYMVGKMEEVKQQMKLYEKMFGRRLRDNKAASVNAGTAAAAAAAPIAGAREVGSVGRSSSSSERSWPTAHRLKLEAEWVLRWVLSAGPSL
jgi:hypothetical protein